MGQAMLDWAHDVDGIFAFIQYEVICQAFSVRHYMPCRRIHFRGLS
jgi:hypothetical protein